MTEPIIGIDEEEIVVYGTQKDARKSSIPLVLRAGYWVKVTVHRFYDYRNAANLGVGSISDLSGKLSEFTVVATSSQPQDAVTMPLYRASDSKSEAYGVSGGAEGEQPATRVHTLNAKDRTSTVMGGLNRTELVGTITRLTTQKSLANGAGRFSIVAKAEAEWGGDTTQAHDALGPLGEDSQTHKYVDSGDWIEIIVVRSDPRNPDVQERTLMVGKVDSVTLSITPAMNGGVDITIEGRDVGCVLEDTPLYFNPYDPTHNNPLGIEMATLINKISGSPDEVVVELLGLAKNPRATFGVPPVLPDGGLWTTTGKASAKFSDVWDDAWVDAMRGIIYDPGLLTPGQYTPLWSYTQTYGVPEMNEWFVDTNPADTGPNNDGQDRTINLFGREKPFVTVFSGEESNWFHLPTSVVHLQEVKTISVSRSGANRYNHINVLAELPSNITSDIMAYCTPAVNFHSVLRWGLKKLDITVPIHAVENGGSDGAFYEEVKQWRDLMICWNVLNPYYWEGTIQIQGIRADIRVGSKIIMEGGPVPYDRNGVVTAVRSDYVARSHYNGEKWVDQDLGRGTTFYVEAVSCTWGAGLSPVATTTVQVSRGYVEADRLKDVTALYALWENATDGKSGQIPNSPQLDNGLYDGDLAPDGWVTV